MISQEEIVKKWDSIHHYDGGSIQLAPNLPLDWHLGYNSFGKKSLSFICEEDPPKFPSSKSIDVRKGKRHDEKWTITFDLQSDAQLSVFTTLCCDLIIYSSAADNENKALALTAKRFQQWNKLLAKQNKHLLDENVRRGLIGELLFLLEKIKGSENIKGALLGWVGPDRGDQDFVYADSWYEIKTILRSSSVCTISSLEQLSLKTKGKLVVYKIDKCAPEMSDAFSLPELVNNISARLADYPEALDIYENKLLSYGFLELPEYEDQRYCCNGKCTYIVDDTFPKLTEEIVPKSIIAVQYSLDTAGVTRWLLSKEQVVSHE